MQLELFWYFEGGAPPSSGNSQVLSDIKMKLILLAASRHDQQICFPPKPQLS